MKKEVRHGSKLKIWNIFVFARVVTEFCLSCARVVLEFCSGSAQVVLEFCLSSGRVLLIQVHSMPNDIVKEKVVTNLHDSSMNQMFHMKKKMLIES